MFKLNEKQISAIKDFLKKSIEVLLLVIITLVSFSIKYGIIIIKIIVKNAIIFTKVFVYYFIE